MYTYVYMLLPKLQSALRCISASSFFPASSHCRSRYFATASLISSVQSSRKGTIGSLSHQSGVSCFLETGIK